MRKRSGICQQISLRLLCCFNSSCHMPPRHPIIYIFDQGRLKRNRRGLLLSLSTKSTMSSWQSVSLHNPHFSWFKQQRPELSTLSLATSIVFAFLFPCFPGNSLTNHFEQNCSQTLLQMFYNGRSIVQNSSYYVRLTATFPLKLCQFTNGFSIQWHCNTSHKIHIIHFLLSLSLFPLFIGRRCCTKTPLQFAKLILFSDIIVVFLLISKLGNHNQQWWNKRPRTTSSVI